MAIEPVTCCHSMGLGWADGNDMSQHAHGALHVSTRTRCPTCLNTHTVHDMSQHAHGAHVSALTRCRTCLNTTCLNTRCVNTTCLNTTCLNTTCLDTTCINTCLNTTFLKTTCLNATCLNTTCLNTHTTHNMSQHTHSARHVSTHTQFALYVLNTTHRGRGIALLTVMRNKSQPSIVGWHDKITANLRASTTVKNSIHFFLIYVPAASRLDLLFYC